ncbi:MAG: T9SS type A sorting domain-containing protein [Chlorobi bacterium]|nr:T9SS type A sorting domain-containing protein [Chlorobiota bacterium]
MKRFYVPIVLLCFVFLSLISSSFAQIQITTSIDPEIMVENITGNGIVFDNVSYTGADIASGVFTNGNTTNLGFDSGIFLTSGSGNIIPGPNTACSAGNNNGMPGDPLLTDIIGINTYDASVLEFDFVPEGDTIMLRYIFGSEEYNEWVDVTYIDAFRVFISGPSPDGIFFNNKNITIIPGSDPEIPTGINNVNNGWAPCEISPTGPCTYCDYYVDNTFGTSIEYDGFTTMLSARLQVIPGEAYHLKIAIADAGDGILDSGIFLEENSLTSSSNASINSFGFNAENNPGLENDVYADFFNDSISLIVPYATDLSNLVASFSLSPGAEAFVDGELQQSGITANDFTNPVVYTVVSEEKSEKDWLIIVDMATGILDKEVAKTQVYPNPANKVLNINCIADCRVRFSNPEGKTINRFNWGKGLHQISISELPDGVYYLLFTTNESVFSRKIIIAR